MANAFQQLYSPEQMAAFERVRAALVADPTALDNRGGAAESVAALNEDQQNGKGST